MTVFLVFLHRVIINDKVIFIFNTIEQCSLKRFSYRHGVQSCIAISKRFFFSR